jgi:hypothetical protein
MKVVLNLRLLLCGMLLAPSIGLAQARPHLTVGKLDGEPAVAPSLDLNGGEPGNDFSVTFTQGGGPVPIVDGDASDNEALTVMENTNHLVSATIRLTNNLDGAAETLAVTTTGTNITATLGPAGADRTLTLMGFDSRSAYQQVLRTATYNNAAVSPNTTPRTVEFRLDDGDAQGPVATTTINIAGAPIPTPTPTPTPSATPIVTPTPTPSPTPTPTSAQALNISTRLRVDVGDRVMIGGFIVRGTASKPVVIRGLGPSLVNSGVPAANVLNDPMLELRGSDGTLILSNDDWQDSPQKSQIEGTIYEPTDDREAVIVATLAPENYTAILSGVGQTTGIGLVEIYDNDAGLESDLANISTRGFVRIGDEVMIGGFTLGENSTPTRIAVRALGPSLTSAGLSDVLADPTLELHNADGTIMVSNDDWGDDSASAAELTANGLALPNPKESGIFTSIAPPGQFTAIVAGKDGGIGIALVEIYNLK